MHREPPRQIVEPSFHASTSIYCIGINHGTAPAELRERVAFPAGLIPAALRSARIDAGIGRLVILSTCHRTELYAEAETGSEFESAGLLLRWLAAGRSLPVEALAGHAYSLFEEAAVRHLYRLSTGLESLVPGEPQIIAQIAGASRLSVASHAISPRLKKIFRNAVRAGERARAEVWGRYRAANIGTAAVAAASAVLARRGLDLEATSVSIFGAGEVAGLTLAALASAGVRNVTVVNRTPDRAASVAARHGAIVRPFDELESTLAETQLAVFAMSGSHAILRRDAAERVVRARDAHPLTLIDIGMPRNVDPAIRAVEGMEILDIDDVSRVGHDIYASRLEAAGAVESIVDQALAALRPRPSGVPAECRLAPA